MAKLPPIPEWAAPALQGLSYWLGVQHAVGLAANISEGAIAWELSRLVFAHRTVGRFIEAEVLYRHVPEFNTSGQLHQSRERADLVIATVVRSDRATPYQMGEVEAVLEVKHNRSRKPLVWDDIDFLGKRRVTSKAVRSFLIYTAVNERPNEFTDDYGAAILPRNRKTPNDTAYRVRRVRRATQRIPSKNKLAIGHYANLIEVSPSS